MDISICLATHNKPRILHAVLTSIYAQSPPFDFETIMVDDGPDDDSSRLVCAEFPVHYLSIDRKPGYRNPALARNTAYRLARGEVIVCQSDDVVHQGEAVEGLVDELVPGRFVIATVHNTDLAGETVPLYGHWPMLTAPLGRFRRPLFFLGAVYRSDLYAVGGNDEDFVAPGWEDNWFADCLINGAGLQPHYSEAVVGHHIHHERPGGLAELTEPSRLLYERKVRQANSGEIPWAAPGAPWPMSQGCLT